MANLSSFKAGDRVRALCDSSCGDILSGNEFDVIGDYGEPGIHDNAGDYRTQPSAVGARDEVDFALVPSALVGPTFGNLCKAVADAQMAVGIAIGKREAAQAELDAFVEQSIKRAAEVA